MKLSILAGAILSSIAFGTLAQEQLNVDVLGEAAYGFEYSDRAEGAKDISKVDFGVSATYGDMYAMVFGESGTVTDEGHGHGVSSYGVIMNRVYVGYNLDENFALQIGSMDAALDLVKDYGNKTIEYSLNAKVVEDVKLAIGAFGTVGAVDYGVTINSQQDDNTGFQSGWNDHSALSAYAKTTLSDDVSFLAGFEYAMTSSEAPDFEDSVVAMAAIDFNLVGANIYHDTKTEATGGSVSIGGNALESLYLAAGYNFETNETNADISYVNLGFAWQQTSNFVLKADSMLDLESTDDHKFWVRQIYTF